MLALKPLQDARDYQILFLLFFLVLGIGTRDWILQPSFIALIFAICWITQWMITKNLNSLRSATITALGLCLLFRSDDYLTIAIAAGLAILSKFVFQSNGKHWFNPANFGIVTALVLTNHAWVSNGQWGDDLWYALIFFGMGGLVLKRVGRWDTSIAFLGSYACLEAIRNFWLGWTWDVLAHRLMSGSLLLFALFMITDPRSIPNARVGRVVWAVAIAILTFILRNQFYVTDAMFYALFALSPLTMFIDRIWQAPRFSWHPLQSPQSQIRPQLMATEF